MTAYLLQWPSPRILILQILRKTVSNSSAHPLRPVILRARCTASDHEYTGMNPRDDAGDFLAYVLSSGTLPQPGTALEWEQALSLADRWENQ